MKNFKSLIATAAVMSSLTFPALVSASTIQEEIAGLYIAFFNRAADENGLHYWEAEAETLGENTALKNLAAGFATHPKFTDLYKDMENKQFVETIYLNILGQEGDAEGIAYWTEQLNNGMSRSDMVAEFILVTLNFDPTDPQYSGLVGVESSTQKGILVLESAQERKELLYNKVYTSLKFVERLGEYTNLDPNTDPTNPKTLNSDRAYKASVNILYGIGSDVASKEKAFDVLDLVAKDPYYAIDTLNRLREQFGTVLQNDTIVNMIDSLMKNLEQNNAEFGTIVSPVTGKVWMDRNLGASEVCISPDDAKCYGDYYQWGRYPDGHEKADSQTTLKLATTYPPQDDKFVIASYDWIKSDTNGEFREKTYNVCPVGFRVPTINELLAEKIKNSNDAFDRFKLPEAGERDRDGRFEDKEKAGYLLSSTTVIANNYKLLKYTDGYAAYNLSSRASGVNIRCIKTVEPISWVVGEWSSCDVGCGTKNGYQSRSVTCQDGSGNFLNDSYCLDPKPLSEQSCTVETEISCNTGTPYCAIPTQTIVEGKIVDLGNGYVSVDKWYFHHDGGDLEINLLSERGDGTNWTDIDQDGVQTNLDTYIYLFQDDGTFSNLVAANDDGGETGQPIADGTLDGYDSYLYISNLPAGDYVLSISDYRLTETEAAQDSQEEDGYGAYRITFDGSVIINTNLLPNNATQECKAEMLAS